MDTAIPHEYSSGTPSPETSSSLSHPLTRMSSFDMSETSPLTPQLENVLVIGGCGFLGHHVVKMLLTESTCTSISVMCRAPFKNTFKRVKYYIGDVTNAAHVHHVVNQVKPKVIFNTASPHAYKDHEHVPDIFRVNVVGNQNLLDAAAEVGTVKAYVYTSSGPIIAGSGGGYDHADETYPTLVVPVVKKGDPYHVAKALGDKMVLEANGKNGIRTCCIRPTALYGEGDAQMVGPVIKALEDGQTSIWMGYNDIEMDVVYVGHVAIAEIQAAKGLLAEMLDPKAPKVAGEAFNITDDQPSPPLTFFRKYWALAGDNTPLSSVWYIPPMVVLIMAHIAEWLVWATTWGKLRPESLILERMEFILYTRTYSVKKARERLGFVPWEGQVYKSQDEALKGAVEWYLRPENHGPVKRGGGVSWPETPFKLISLTSTPTTPFPPTPHYSLTNARIMAQTHNTIFRALNSIYAHSFLVSPSTSSASDLLSYCLITYDFIHHHQLSEELHYFPAIEAASGIKGLMQGNVEQHKLVEEGLEAFRKYAENTRAEEFSGKKLRGIIDGFKGAYERHQFEEVREILGLWDKIDSEELKRIDKNMRAESEKGSDVFKAAPFVLGNQDKTFILDSLPHTAIPFPNISLFSKLIISLFLTRRHSSVWRFNTSSIYGTPRPMPTERDWTAEVGSGKVGKVGGGKGKGLIAPGELPIPGMPKSFHLRDLIPDWERGTWVAFGVAIWAWWWVWF